LVDRRTDIIAERYAGLRWKKEFTRAAIGLIGESRQVKYLTSKQRPAGSGPISRRFLPAMGKK